MKVNFQMVFCKERSRLFDGLLIGLGDLERDSVQGSRLGNFGFKKSRGRDRRMILCQQKQDSTTAFGVGGQVESARAVEAGCEVACWIVGTEQRREGAGDEVHQHRLNPAALGIAKHHVPGVHGILKSSGVADTFKVNVWIRIR